MKSFCAPFSFPQFNLEHCVELRRKKSWIEKVKRNIPCNFLRSQQWIGYIWEFCWHFSILLKTIYFLLFFAPWLLCKKRQNYCYNIEFLSLENYDDRSRLPISYLWLWHLIFIIFSQIVLSQRSVRTKN